MWIAGHLCHTQMQVPFDLNDWLLLLLQPKLPLGPPFFFQMWASHSFGSPFVCDLAKEKTYLLKVMNDPSVVIFQCLFSAHKQHVISHT